MRGKHCRTTRTIRSSFVAVATALLVQAPVHGADPDDFVARVEAFVEEAWPEDGPGAVVVVARDGRTVVETARGLADLETGEPLTPATVFELGSTTKQVTAAVVLDLVEEGAMELDAPLRTYLPDYAGPGADATVRQLLAHTAGVPDVNDIPHFEVEENTTRKHTTEKLLGIIAEQPAAFEPGAAWEYSSTNYILLGAAIEAVTGSPWHEAVHERIAKPLGLRTLRYAEDEAIRDDLAEGYTTSDGEPREAVDVHASTGHAAGGLAASGRDLATWMHALHSGEVISRESFEAMTTPGEPNDPVTPYGFGLRLEEIRGHHTITHGGWINGYTNQTVYAPAEDLYVAVLANSDDPATSVETAVRRIAARVLGDPYPRFEAVEPDPETLQPLFGVYALEDGDGTRQFFARDGKLYTLRSGSSESRVYWAGGERFFYGPGRLTWFEIVPDDDGRHRMEMHQQGAAPPEVAVRTGPVPERPDFVDLPGEVLDAYVGQYRLGPEAFVTVARDEEGLTARITGQSAVRIRPVGETEFLVEGIDAEMVFQREDGEVTGLVIHQGKNTTPVAERVED